MRMKMRCHQFREIADSRLGSDGSVGTTHAVNLHLAKCAECQKELSARRELRTRLRHALINAPENRMRPEFASILRTRLRDYAETNPNSVAALDSSSSPAKFHRVAALALAACIVLALGIGPAVLREWHTLRTAGRDRLAVSSHAPDPRQLQNLFNASLARSAVGDHRDCAIHFRLSEKPIDLDEAGRKYDPSYVNLSRAVLSGELPAGVEFREAHSCIFESRRFAHIVLRYHGRLVSLLITAIEGNMGESHLSLPTIDRDTAIASSQFDGYQVSGLPTRGHAIFVVSDLSEGENMALARALAPSAVTHITRTEIKA